MASSGTIEEIEKHVSAGKPTMIYFSAVPVRMDSTDEAQYAALKHFKNIQQQNGVVETYETLSEFQSKLAMQLARTIINKFPTSDEIANASSPDASGSTAAKVPTLSESARELLLEASKDATGVILFVHTLGASQLQTHSREFMTKREPREDARWRKVISELKDLGLIEDRAGKQEMFFVTEAGLSDRRSNMNQTKPGSILFPNSKQ